MILQVNESPIKQMQPYLYPTKINFKPKNITRDKDGHYIMIKGTIIKKTFFNICTCNFGAPKYIKQLLTDLKEETDSNTIIAGDF